MRILFITNDTTGTSGWSRYSVDLIKSFKNLGHDVDVVTSDDLGHANKYLLGNIFGFKERNIVKKKIKDFNPDVIHVVAEPYLNGLLFYNLKNIKVFMTIHGTYSFIPALFKGNILKEIISIFLTKIIFKKVSGIISVSSFTKEYFEKEYQKVFKEKISMPIKVITNGVDYKELSSKIIDTNKAGINIVSVGEVKNRKGAHFTLEALNQIKKDSPHKITFNVVGTLYEDSLYHKNLLKKIREFNLEENVFFHGKVSDDKLLDLYNKSNIFIMLSQNIDNKFEGFGIVYLEANAFGIPVIGSIGTGAQEAILDGETGYLVNPKNTEEIIGSVNKILKGDIFAENCKKWSKDNDISTKANQVLEFYNQ